MSKDLTPIETSYNGYRFRSRTEARWAVFLDALGVRYEYEKQGYDLPSGKYLPDFWLRDMKCWLEVRREGFHPDEDKRLVELAETTKSPLMLACGAPDYETMFVYCVFGTPSTGAENRWWEGAFWSMSIGLEPCLCAGDDWIPFLFFYDLDNFMWDGMEPRERCLVGDFDRHCITQARKITKGARFEFGECPTVEPTRGSLREIKTGHRTGAQRAALDVCYDLNFPVEALATAAINSKRYPPHDLLVETDMTYPASISVELLWRSDAMVFVHNNRVSGIGHTYLKILARHSMGKPYLHVSLSDDDCVDYVVKFIHKTRRETSLFVTGYNEGTDLGVYDKAVPFFKKLITRCK